MPRPAASLLALALGVAFVALSGCGEEDAQLLPGGTAREITANLDTVEQLADEGDCIGAESAAQQVSEQVEALSGVDARLKRALEEGTGRLEEVVASCQEETEAVEPLPVPDEAEPDGDEELEKEQEKLKEEEEKRQEKEEERESEDEGEGDDDGEAPPLPPQAEGEGKGLDEGGDGGPGGEEGGGSSGGVSPANPAGEG